MLTSVLIPKLWFSLVVLRHPFAWFLVLATFSGAAAAWAGEKTGEFLSGTEETRIHYQIAGEGPAVVLIHGLASTATENWHRTAPQLSRSFTVVMPDLRGHGHSDKPHDADDYGRKMVDDVIHLMDFLEIEQAHIVGYSMGAFVAMQLSVNHPGRVMSLVVGGQGWATDEQFEAMSAGGGLLRSAESALALVPDASVVREDIRDRFMRTLAANDALALAALMDNYSALAVPEEKLRASTWPLMIVIGSEDPRVSRARALLQLRPDAKMIIVQGETHLTTPVAEEFSSAIDQFIASFYGD